MDPVYLASEVLPAVGQFERGAKHGVSMDSTSCKIGLATEALESMVATRLEAHLDGNIMFHGQLLPFTSVVRYYHP